MTAPPEHEFASRTPTMLYRIQGPTERLLEATAVEAALEPVPAIRPIPGAARPTTTDWMRAATRTEFLRGLCGIPSTSSSECFPVAAPAGFDCAVIDDVLGHLKEHRPDSAGFSNSTF